jgi:RecB family exonuclease
MGAPPLLSSCTSAAKAVASVGIYSPCEPMARLRLITACDPELLLRHAADGFLVRRVATDAEPFPTVPYLLALRQGGLRDDVIEMAAAAKVPGWFDPPLCIFHELPKWLGATERAVLGEYERRVLLSRILSDTGDGVFARLQHADDFVDSVDRLFGELISEDVAPRSLERAFGAQADRDEFERRRDADLARAYSRYHSELAWLGKSDGRATWAHCARAIHSGEASLPKALGSRREIRIFGLQDLRGGWRPLLRALVASAKLDEIAIYTSVALPLDDLAGEVEALPEKSTAATRLFSEPGEPTGNATLVIAPDVDRALDEIARRVRALIDGGARPNRIAVIARKARPHVDLAVSSLRKFGVPATARQRIGLVEIPAIRAIRTLFAAAAEGWTRRGLAEIARQPYLDCQLDARIINSVGYAQRVTGLADWERALRRLEANAKEYEQRIANGETEDTSRGRSFPPAAEVATARECFGRFGVRAKALDRPRPLVEWLRWLNEFLKQDPWGVLKRIYAIPEDRFDIARRDLAGWNGLIEVVREWRDAVQEFGAGSETLDVAAFNVQLRACLDGDVALWTPAHHGVQVIEALAAAYRSFDHVFLVGMEAGAFPAVAPRSPILDESDREALADAGIPIERRHVWEYREQELFRTIVASARETLTLSYARLDDAGRDVIRSSFAEDLADVARLNEAEISPEQVVIAGLPLYRDVDGPVNALRVARMERDRERGQLSRHNGLITRPELVEWLESAFGDDRVWSPTQLEEFAKCPWAYFSKRVLRLQLLEDPDDLVLPVARGFLLHGVLHRFYDDAKTRVGGPVFLRSTDERWVDELLDKAIDAELAEHHGWLGHPALADARRAELRRIALGFLQWEIGLHDEMLDPANRRASRTRIHTAVDEHEVPFEDMVLERKGVRIRYRGSIDRVEVNVDERAPNQRLAAAIDYKTSVWATPGRGDKKAWEDGVVLQVPLYALALEKLRPDHEVARVEYLTLRNPEPVHSLQLYQVTGKGKAPARNEGAVAQWQHALDDAVEHVKNARGGEFPAAPPASCGCPPWCHGWDICRVKGGPRR